MTLYLLCIQPKYRHSGHYLGFTPAEDPARRIAEHLSCGPKSNPLVRTALRAGHRVTHVRTLPGDRSEERRLKNWNRLSRLCPHCQEDRRGERQRLAAKRAESAVLVTCDEARP